MINGEPIFSIDKAMFDDDKFKMKLDGVLFNGFIEWDSDCLLYTSPSPRDS